MIVLDTSAVLALLDADDADHERCVGALSDHDAPFVVPAGILGEVGCLVEAKLGSGALTDLVDDLDRRAFAVDCGDEDFGEIRRLLVRYADLRLGFADAAVIACAARRGVPVLTLDFRDFGPVAREGTIALALPG